MKIFISMLRGINVSGQKKIKMDALRTMYESLGYQNVKTYIQSGNVIFATQKTTEQKLILQIQNQIETTFGYKVRVLIRSIEEMTKTIKDNPFLSRTEFDAKKMYITFLEKKLSKETIDTASNVISNAKKPSEEFRIKGREIYLYCPDGYGRTKLSNNFFEKKLNCAATTRNWKSTNTLLTLAKEAENKIT